MSSSIFYASYGIWTKSMGNFFGVIFFSERPGLVVLLGIVATVMAVAAPYIYDPKPANSKHSTSQATIIATSEDS